MNLFKPGDIVVTNHISKKSFFNAGVTVLESRMIRRTAAFTYKENPTPDKWFKQKEFHIVQTPVTTSAWDTMDDIARKQFLRNIAGYLFRDKTAYDQINNLIKNT